MIKHHKLIALAPILNYDILEDNPRSTPGQSKVLDQIRAIMKLIIVVSTVGTFILKSPQLWAPWLQFPARLYPEAGPEGGIRKCQ